MVQPYGKLVHGGFRAGLGRDQLPHARGERLDLLGDLLNDGRKRNQVV